VLPTFTNGNEIWGGDLKKLHWKVFEKGMHTRMWSCVKVRSLTTYHIVVQIWRTPIELYSLKLTMGFNNCLPTYPPLG
jgi:hypothetical protein